MGTKKQRTYSHYTREAAALLGKEIQLGRKERGLTTSDFADRLGVSRLTLQRVESGDMNCEIGTVLEAATLAGVKLFNVEPSGRSSFKSELERVNDKIALLPQRVRKTSRALDDAF